MQQTAAIEQGSATAVSQAPLAPVTIGLTGSSIACPCSSGGGGGGQAAKDALGNDVKTASWLATHKAGDRSLTQGLKVGGCTDPNGPDLVLLVELPSSHGPAV